jgi:PilZ domain-containing protein
MCDIQEWARRMDRRKSVRVRTKLNGKLLVAGSHRALDCTVLDLSVGGVSIRCQEAVLKRSNVVLYADHLGRLTGTTTQPNKEGTGIRLMLTPRRREKIERYVASQATDGKTAMSAVPINSTPRSASSIFVRPNGAVVDCEIQDISPAGATLRTSHQLPFGEVIQIGRLKARVVWHYEHGIGVEYLEYDPAAPVA